MNLSGTLLPWKEGKKDRRKEGRKERRNMCGGCDGVGDGREGDWGEFHGVTTVL